MPKLLEEHARKVLEGDALHRRIDADMGAIEEKNLRGGKAMRRVISFGALGGGAAAAAALRTAAAPGSSPARRGAVSPADVALHAAFEANVVEAVMLASAVLINLAGIMFDSSRFSGAMLSY
jgi:hypothetical protein